MTTIMSEYDLAKWKAQFPSIIWRCDDAFLGHTIGFADALGKRVELEEKIRQAAFPTFFGVPARTAFTADGLACFYFMIYRAEDVVEVPKDCCSRCGSDQGGPQVKRDARMLMNGGVIFHPRYRRCPESERLIPPHEKCPICGRDGETAEHREVVDYAGGSWSIHT